MLILRCIDLNNRKPLKYVLKVDIIFLLFAVVAQLVEHALGKGEVTDSSSVDGSIFVYGQKG